MTCENNRASWKSTHRRRPGIAQELAEVRIGQIGRPHLGIVTLECKVSKPEHWIHNNCQKMQKVWNSAKKYMKWETLCWVQLLSGPKSGASAWFLHRVVDLMRFLRAVRGRDLNMPSSGSLTEQIHCYLYFDCIPKWVCLKICYCNPLFFVAHHHFGAQAPASESRLRAADLKWSKKPCVPSRTGHETEADADCDK